MPYNTDIIWAGTEIGIFESTDKGKNWHFANNGLPAVSVWQMFIQDNTIVVATHGRGIWTTGLYPVSINKPSLITDDIFETYPNPSSGEITFSLKASGAGEVGIHIYDISGRDVYSSTIQKEEVSLNQQLDLRNLNTGTYIVTIDFKKKLYSSKIIIQ